MFRRLRRGEGPSCEARKDLSIQGFEEATLGNDADRHGFEMFDSEG